ncbi:uroporphyrinogen-III synthase [Sutcliffiella horikoshii]|uniref:Uroporphyrinogen-III synthase n=1 Tax=Sutcliffiella horikoshii TaxID=79883 RepID=A0A5D4T232_9BACI|nr:uroporphyrinogen-III synthase [Sutcliffiella horikoshii]TYS68961.1 uroporphyrinogen-III synthase [Sutcliffiella horikoshii]
MDRTLPLADKRILITRSKEQARYFSKQIQSLGGTSLEVPLIQFQHVSDNESVAEDIKSNLPDYEWIVFTSVNGVKYFFELYQGRLPNKIAVVGAKTKQALEVLGYKVDLVPSRFSAEDLIDSFAKETISSILLIQGNLARPLLREELSRIGYNVKQIVVYENRIRVPEEKEWKWLKEGKVDLYTFTSPSTVHNYMKLFGLPKGPVATIGPITRNAAEKAGINVAISPSEYTMDGLLEEIVQYFKREDT